MSDLADGYEEGWVVARKIRKIVDRFGLQVWRMNDFGTKLGRYEVLAREVIRQAIRDLAPDGEDRMSAHRFIWSDRSGEIRRFWCKMGRVSEGAVQRIASSVVSGRKRVLYDVKRGHIGDV